ncbi:MAG: DUF5711 family protein [Clostridia bacterium]|nr:DUF5711 family protein [Clostridia bacterium]
MKKISIIGALVALVLIVFLLIDSSGLVQKKLSYIADITDESTASTNQSEYVVLNNDNVLEIQKETVSCFNFNKNYAKNLIWQETSYIKNPEVCKKGGRVCVYDKQGYGAVVYDENGKVYELKVNLPIVGISMNKNGYTCVLQKSNTSKDKKSIITVFNDMGSKMIERISYEENGGIPIAVSMSDSNETFAASYLDVSNNNILSKVIFFKIDGKELKDNLFSSFEFSNTIITDLKYLNDENLIAVGDNKIVKINLFSEKCQETKVEDRVKKVILDFDDSIVLICEKLVNELSDDATYVEVFSNSLKKKKEQIIYNSVNQIATNKNVLTVGNGNDFFIYTSKGVNKCSSSFTANVKQLLPMNKSSNMLVVTDKCLQIYRMQYASIISND